MTTRAPVDPAGLEHCSSELLQRVSVGETDMMGVVHHGSYIAYFERGRLEYMRRRGMPYKALVERGHHLPVVELNVRYKKPAYFDDLLSVETRLGTVTRVTVRFDYRVRRPCAEAGAAHELLLEAHVVLACIDARGKPRPLPADALRVLLAPELASSDAHS
ncbi:MAG TPA: thioesterase family protein [Polyangiaceae bacterium]|nr:thioesterase family protein [Polyangiaceae bacterium]